jgi:hypothetical protein
LEKSGLAHGEKLDRSAPKIQQPARGNDDDDGNVQQAWMNGYE